MWSFLRQKFDRDQETLLTEIGTESAETETLNAKAKKHNNELDESEKENNKDINQNNGTCVQFEEIISSAKANISKKDSKNLCFGTTLLSLLHIANEKVIFS